MDEWWTVWMTEQKFVGWCGLTGFSWLRWKGIFGNGNLILFVLFLKLKASFLIKVLHCSLADIWYSGDLLCCFLLRLPAVVNILCNLHETFFEILLNADQDYKKCPHCCNDKAKFSIKCKSLNVHLRIVAPELKYSIQHVFYTSIRCLEFQVFLFP